MYRHGDLLLIPVSHEEQGEVVRGTVILRGEATGHAHRLTEESDIVYREGVPVGLTLSESCDLVHEEHNTIRLPAGPYRVVVQREYDPDGNRPVVD